MTRAQRIERMFNRVRKVERESGYQVSKLPTPTTTTAFRLKPMTTAEASERGIDLYGERE